MKKLFLLLSFVIPFTTTFAQENRSPEQGKSSVSPELLTGKLIRKIKSLRNYQWSENPVKAPSRSMNGLIFKKTYKEEIRDFGSSGLLSKGKIPRKPQISENASIKTPLLIFVPDL